MVVKAPRKSLGAISAINTGTWFIVVKVNDRTKKFEHITIVGYINKTTD